MRPCRLQLENYRAFRDADIRFPRTGLVLIAGPNNVGKTALLSALDAVVGNYGDLPSLRHRGALAPTRLGVTFDLDDAERAAMLDEARGGRMLFEAGVLASLQFVFEQWQDQGLLLREIHGSWPNLGLQPLAVMQPHPGQENRYVYSMIDAFQLDDDQSARAGATLEVPDQTYRLLKEVPGITSDGNDGLDSFLMNSPGRPPLMAPLAAWRSRFYHFRALRTGTQRSQPTASPERLTPAGDNLAGVLHYLLTDRPNLFAKVSDLIAELVPGIGFLRVRTGGGDMRVVFESVIGDLNLKDLGTGVEQLLMTIIVGLTEEPPFTLVIEEPETNLNPGAQRALLALLQEWASDRLIVAATHSTVMLDWSPAGDRLWLVTREENDSHVKPVSTDPLPLLDALGVRLSDVLSADRVLILEGDSDRHILQVWFPEELRHPRVAVLPGHGGDNARHAGQFAKWLAGTDRAGLRQVLYLRDRDELAPEMLERLTRSPSVHVLQRREIENYLLDSAALAAVIQPLTPPGASAPDIPAIERALNAAAEGLRQKIVINRVARRIAPAQPLMNNELRKQLAANRVDLAEFIKIVTERLMTAIDLQEQVTAAWEEAEADVATHTGDALLAIAPGEEILDELFLQYAGRHYLKSVHGPEIAAAMNRPGELEELFTTFMAD